MTTKPPQPPASLQQEVERTLAGGLGQLGTQQLIGLLLNCLFQAERKTYL